MAVVAEVAVVAAAVAAIAAEVAAIVVAAVAEKAVRCGEGWCESASERVRGDPSPNLGCC